MAVKIVTDSVSDIPADIVKALDITVVPLIVRFSGQVYRDGIDLTAEEFYEKLKTAGVMPVSSVPSPGVFAETFDSLARSADELIVLTVSSRLSGVYSSVLQGIEAMQKKCPVTVLDTATAAMCQGFLVMEAAAAAQEGAGVREIEAIVRKNAVRVDFLSTFDTLEYLKRGGRIGKAQAFLGAALKINPLITLRNGVVEPAGRARSRKKAVQRLVDFVKSYSSIERIAVEDTACAGEADELAARLAEIAPGIRILRSKMTPAIGTHTGPGLLVAAVMGKKSGE